MRHGFPERCEKHIRCPEDTGADRRRPRRRHDDTRAVCPRPENAMKIHQLLDRDPLQVRLANSGQARITSGTDPKVMRELRAELETFVCKGKFADALQRILERYLASLDASRQDAVWVSGFFGSGKSHLLKMLAHLWVNTGFEDGADGQGSRGRPAAVRGRACSAGARRPGAPPWQTACRRRRIAARRQRRTRPPVGAVHSASGHAGFRNSTPRPGSASG